MSKKTTVPVSAAKERIEQLQVEAVPVDLEKERLEGEVERAKTKKLREVRPSLREADRKERKLEGGVLALVRRNKNKTGFFDKGRRSIQTRGGIAGVRAVSKVSVPKGMTDDELVGIAKSIGIKSMCVKTYERFNKTLFRQNVQNGNISTEQAESMGCTIVKYDREYSRLKKVGKKKKKTSRAKGGKKK
jgi:hypothetical protein